MPGAAQSIYILYILYIIYNMYGCHLLAELLFPTRCAGCGRYEGRLLCASCLSSLPLIKGKVCLRCGKPTLYEVEWCLLCRRRVRHLDATAALAVYEEPMRSAIHKLKYGNGWRLARPLGFMAAVRLAPLLRGSHPLVTFVPMHPRKRRARGYDHAEILGKAVAEALGLTFAALLERTRVTSPQASLDYRSRKGNVRGSFRPAREKVRGREVVVVDDVMTTGYTLAECARVLKVAGAEGVTACVLARDLVDSFP